MACCVVVAVENRFFAYPKEYLGLAARPSLSSRPLHVFSVFLPNRPTHLHEREGDGKRNILWGWPKLKIRCMRQLVYIENCMGKSPDR